MVHYPLAFLFACAATAAAAGPYDRPSAIVESADPSTGRKEFRPAINQVDGRRPRAAVKGDALEPGKHEGEIRFDTGRVNQGSAGAERRLELEVEGCPRYRIAAQRTTVSQ